MCLDDSPRDGFLSGLWAVLRRILRVFGLHKRVPATSSASAADANDEDQWSAEADSPYTFGQALVIGVEDGALAVGNLAGEALRSRTVVSRNIKHCGDAVLDSNYVQINDGQWHHVVVTVLVSLETDAGSVSSPQSWKLHLSLYIDALLHEVRLSPPKPLQAMTRRVSACRSDKPRNSFLLQLEKQRAR